MFALLLTVNVTVRSDVVTVPLVNDAVSQVGIPEIENPTLPELALN